MNLEQLKQLVSSDQVAVPQSDANHMRASIEPGQIRPVLYQDEKGRFNKRYVMITHQYGDLPEIAGAMLILDLPAYASHDDVKFGPQDLEYPIVGAIETSNQAPVLVADLGQVVGQINGELLDLVLRLNRGGRRDATRTGRIILEPDDLRAQVAADEWQTMQMIAEEAFQHIHEVEDLMLPIDSLESKLIEIEGARTSLQDSLEYHYEVRALVGSLVTA
ncbi:MAG: hypothetical protein ACKOI2_08280 [Actinomycetota bacterium]